MLLDLRSLRFQFQKVILISCWLPRKVVLFVAGIFPPNNVFSSTGLLFKSIFVFALMHRLNNANAVSVCWEGDNALVLQENSILSLLDMSSHSMSNVIIKVLFDTILNNRSNLKILINDNMII